MEGRHLLPLPRPPCSRPFDSLTPSGSSPGRAAPHPPGRPLLRLRSPHWGARRGGTFCGGTPHRPHLATLASLRAFRSAAPRGSPTPTPETHRPASSSHRFLAHAPRLHSPSPPGRFGLASGRSHRLPSGYDDAAKTPPLAPPSVTPCGLRRAPSRHLRSLPPSRGPARCGTIHALALPPSESLSASSGSANSAGGLHPILGLASF